MSGFELPPVAISNTWKKREGKEEGREREKIWDLVFFSLVVCLGFFLTLCEPENPHSIPQWGKMQPHIPIPMLDLGLFPSQGCPNLQEGLRMMGNIAMTLVSQCPLPCSTPLLSRASAVISSHYLSKQTPFISFLERFHLLHPSGARMNLDRVGWKLLGSASSLPSASPCCFSSFCLSFSLFFP